MGRPRKITTDVILHPSDQQTRLESLLAQVLEGLKDIKEAVARPITSQAPSLKGPLPQLTNEQIKAPEEKPHYPIPPAYRDAVDSVLNKDFGVEIEGHQDTPQITLTIVVPDKYSTASQAQKEVIGGRDIRPKVLAANAGVAELKECLQLVYSNFSPEIQALIVADRTK